MPSLIKSVVALSCLFSLSHAYAADSFLASPFGKAAPVSHVTPVEKARSSNFTPTTRAAAISPIPRYDHVVIVIMENENQENIIGNSSAPFMNYLAQSGASFNDAHGVTHPSQPNYLALFSGSTQGVSNDNCPNTFRNKANLGNQLLSSGFSFAGYSEDMPSDGYTGCRYDNYARKHNPWVNFTNVPASANKTFASFPGDFRALPTVSFVIPNLCNDDHDCPTSTGDAWLQNNLGAYAEWAKANNSLLVLTWDEDEFRAENHITTIFFGANVNAGNYDNRINHYDVLRTLQDMYGLAPVNNSKYATPITNIWNTRGR